MDNYVAGTNVVAAHARAARRRGPGTDNFDPRIAETPWGGTTSCCLRSVAIDAGAPGQTHRHDREVHVFRSDVHAIDAGGTVRQLLRRRFIDNRGNKRRLCRVIVELALSILERNRMLVVTSKAGEKVKIGDQIEITIVRIGPEAVRIGIDAPPDLNVVRTELVGHVPSVPRTEQPLCDER